LKCLTNNYLSRDPHFVILVWEQSWNIYEKHMKLWISPKFFHKNTFHQQFPLTWSTFRLSSMGTKFKYFWETHETVKSAWIFLQKHVHEQLLFTRSTFRHSSMSAKFKWFWKTHETGKSAWSFFKKTCLTYNCLSRDPHFVILAFVQNRNIFEKLMKVCSPLDFFHKSMSHEQLRLTWSIFRDSSMGTKLKDFSKTHESVKSAKIISQQHVSRTNTFHVIHISSL